MPNLACHRLRPAKQQSVDGNKLTVVTSSASYHVPYTVGKQTYERITQLHIPGGDRYRGSQSFALPPKAPARVAPAKKTATLFPSSSLAYQPVKEVYEHSFSAISHPQRFAAYQTA